MSMKMPSKLTRIIVILTFIFIQLSIVGCGTARTLKPAFENGPHVMSGSRFDILAMQDKSRARVIYGSEPIKYPLLDLPFSFLLDTVLLPLTVSNALASTIVK